MRKTYLLLTLLLLCVGISIHAQVTTASMSGKVTDTSSEAMIGVNIKATHTPTGTEYYTITSRMVLILLTTFVSEALMW